MGVTNHFTNWDDPPSRGSFQKVENVGEVSGLISKSKYRYTETMKHVQRIVRVFISGKSRLVKYYSIWPDNITSICLGMLDSIFVCLSVCLFLTNGLFH